MKGPKMKEERPVLIQGCTSNQLKTSKQVNKMKMMKCLLFWSLKIWDRKGLQQALIKWVNRVNLDR